MNILWASFLGILQGLTEFLPVSSSGHLVIAQHIIPGFVQPGVLFDVTLHLGTMMSVLFYFRKDILSIDKRYIYLIFLGTLPVVFVGFIFQDSIEQIFSSLRIVGLALILTSIFNYFTDKATDKSSKLLPKKALVVGIFQALAIVPGISRSGSTIFAATKLGIKRVEAAKYSFLLSVPAILGANALQLFKYSGGGELNTSFYIAGFVSAFFSGYFAIKWLLKLLSSRRFIYFSVYCFFVGILVLVL